MLYLHAVLYLSAPLFKSLSLSMNLGVHESQDKISRDFKSARDPLINAVTARGTRCKIRGQNLKSVWAY